MQNVRDGRVEKRWVEIMSLPRNITCKRDIIIGSHSKITIAYVIHSSWKQAFNVIGSIRKDKPEKAVLPRLDVQKQTNKTQWY